MSEICCRWSPTLGRLAGTHQEMWGTKDYDPATDSEKPCVFFGLYGLPDFYALWRHKGKKWILWAGTDILHFKRGYWLEEGGEILLDCQSLALWISKYCESWTENKVEAEALKEVGIDCQVCPSFLGNTDKYQLSYEPSDRVKLYASVSGDNFEQYGWNKLGSLAWSNPQIEFNLYGNNSRYVCEGGWPNNVKIHGRVSEEQMNEETKHMQGGLRMLTFDGFSEILGKSVLWGQWPISLIKYPFILSVDEIDTIKDRKTPNIEGREYYLNKLNSYPWNLKK